MNTYYLVLILGCIFLYEGLIVVTKYSEKILSPYWKILYLLPGGLALVLISYAGFTAVLIPVVIGVLASLVGFVSEKRKVRTIICGFGLLMTVISGILAVSLKNSGDYNYTDNFDKAFAKIKDEYILAEYKDIDYDRLYEKYYPMFKQAERDKDPVENVIIWAYLADEFHDGHVSYACGDEEIVDEAERRMYGYDYGLSVMRLSDGRFVAVNVDEDLAPLTNGCEILEWNGESPENILSSNNTSDKEVTFGASVNNPIVYMPNMPVLENENFYKPLLIGGIGGETVEVSYVDNDGNMVSATLSQRGFYCDRLEETIGIIDRAVDDIGTLSWKEVDESTCLFRIKQMTANLNSYGKDEYDSLKNSMREQMLAYKEAGYDTLIFDIRNNGGGDPYMIMAMASLVLPEGEQYYCSTGAFNEETFEYEQNEEGSFVLGEQFIVNGENIWNHGRIIVLVNASCISAGDHFTCLLDKCPNATIMGFTSSNSSGQAVNSVAISDNEQFSYSAVPTIDADGRVFVDAGADRLSKVGIDRIIEFDENAVKALFDEDRDYVLAYCRQ